MDYKYKYFYKTTNLVNGKIYYGIHRTNNINDGYLGSGTVLQFAIDKYGKDLFAKEILEFFDTEEDLLEFEARIVNSDFVKQKGNYNLALGGLSPTVAQIADWWASENGKKLKALYQARYGGYQNPDFLKRWKLVYDQLVPRFCQLAIETNLPDQYILRQIINKQHVKLGKLIKYAIYNKEITQVLGINIYKDFFTQTGRPNYFRKTEILSDKYSGPIVIYKAFHANLLDAFQETVGILQDTTLSDSMLYNHIEGIKNSRLLHNRAKYYEYLGLLKRSGIDKINVRIRRPNSRRVYGQKTLYEINQHFLQYYKLVGRQLDEQYILHFNGNALSWSRL